MQSDLIAVVVCFAVLVCEIVMPIDPDRIAPESPAALLDLLNIVDWLHADHRTSFIAAGDQKVFAYGGNGYTLVCSDRLFDDVIELTTPNDSVRIEPDSTGRLKAALVGDPVTSDLSAVLEQASVHIRLYYKRRYWK